MGSNSRRDLELDKILNISGKTRTGIMDKLSSAERSKLISELAIPRGQKLKKIRHILNLSMESFAKLLDINSAQIGRLERGEVCLSEPLAEYFLKRIYSELDKVNLQVQQSMLKWLLYGSIDGKNQEEKEGAQEIMFKKFEKDGIRAEKYFENSENCENEGVAMEDQNIMMEGASMYFGNALFKKFDKNTVSTLCRDDKMDPSCKKGDYLVGIKVKKEFYHLANGEECIIELGSRKGSRLVRRFYIDTETGTYIICGYKDSTPVVLTETPSLLAIVVFKHRMSMKIPAFRRYLLFNEKCIDNDPATCMDNDDIDGSSASEFVNSEPEDLDSEV
jgi:hypothetical protein